MLPYVVLAAFKSQSDASKARATLCWMLLFYLNMCCALGGDGTLSSVLLWLDIAGQLASNWFIVFHASGVDRNNNAPTRACLHALHALAALTHVGTGAFGGGIKWSLRSVAVSNMSAIWFAGRACGARNEHFNVAMGASMLTGLLLKLSERHSWLRCIGHVSALVYTAQCCKAIGIDIE